MTYFYMDIKYHVNLIGPTTPFGTQNESHHFDWRDSFWIKISQVFFLIVYCFL
jgi:hypothetical protein